jgi:hypothetical protein
LASSIVSLLFGPCFVNRCTAGNKTAEILLPVVHPFTEFLYTIFLFSDNVTKDKSQGSLFRSVLKCIPYLIEEVGRNDKMTEIIPQHGISIDPGVREEAVQVLNRIIRYLPHSRFAVWKGMANFILKLPDEFPLLIQTSLGRLVELMRLWRVSLSEEVSGKDMQNVRRSSIGSDVLQRSPFHRSRDVSEFRAYEMDAVGLVFLSSADVQIRLTALELLRCVRALKNDLRDYTANDWGDNKLKHEPEPIFIIDIIEENGVSYLFSIALNCRLS